MRATAGRPAAAPVALARRSMSGSKEHATGRSWTGRLVAVANVVCCSHDPEGRDMFLFFFVFSILSMRSEVQASGPVDERFRLRDVFLP